MRLFIAIKLDTEMKQLVGSIQNSFRRQSVRGNYTPDENLHITLAFIGEYGDPDMVLEAMEEVSFSPFMMTMDKVGCFDQLWWAGIDDSAELEKLAGKLRRALADAGIPFDRQRFKPHVTFLRKAENADKKRISHLDIRPVSMQVDRISLMQSTRGKNGMIYTELGSVAAGDVL